MKPDDRQEDVDEDDNISLIESMLVMAALADEEDFKKPKVVKVMNDDEVKKEAVAVVDYRLRAKLKREERGMKKRLSRTHLIPNEVNSGEVETWYQEEGAPVLNSGDGEGVDPFEECFVHRGNHNKTSKISKHSSRGDTRSFSSTSGDSAAVNNNRNPRNSPSAPFSPKRFSFLQGSRPWTSSAVSDLTAAYDRAHHEETRRRRSNHVSRRYSDSFRQRLESIFSRKSRQYARMERRRSSRKRAPLSNDNTWFLQQDHIERGKDATQVGMMEAVWFDASGDVFGDQEDNVHLGLGSPRSTAF